MALESTSLPLPVPDGPASLFAAAMAVGKPADPTPVAPAPEHIEPAAEPTLVQDTRTGLDALGSGEPEAETKLPIEETAPEQKKGRDPAGDRIKALKDEIASVHTPRIKELEDTLTQREARLLELEGLAAERETLKQQQVEWETEMKVVKLERTPEFIKVITDPIQKIETRARELAETYGIDENQLFKAFTEGTEKDRRSALKAATDGLEVDVDDSFEIRELIKQYLPIVEKREELYADADKALAELSARKEGEIAQQAAARAEERGKAADMVAGRVAAALPYLKSEVNALLSSVKSTNFDSLTPVDLAYNAFAGTLLAKMDVKYKALQAELDEALDEIATTRKTTPRVGPGSVTGSHVEAPMSLIAAARAAMGG